MFKAIRSEEVYILNSEGRVVAHRNPSVVLRSTYVSKPYTSGVREGLSGNKVVFAAERIEKGNLVLWVVIEKSFSTAIQGAMSAILLIALVTITSFVIAVLLAVPVAGNIVRPIQQLAKSSKAIMEGDFTSNVPVKGKGEIAELSSVFNKMTGQLHRLIEELKAEVNIRKTAELSLQISEERYRELAENITEVFWIVSHDWGEVIYVSPAYENTWGRSIESLYKDPISWMDSIVDEDKNKVTESIEHNQEGASEIIFPEYRIQKPDGQIRWIFARGFPIRAADGSISRVVGIAEDITERKKAEEMVLQSNSLMNAIIQSPKRILIFALDRNYKYITFNENHKKAMKAIHGADIEMEMNMLDLLKDPKVYQKAKLAYDRALSGESFSEIQNEPGTAVYWEFQWNPVVSQTDHVIGLTCFAQDISERKNSEELIKANLKEKETLLQEIHHRVKNNMQVINSLLKLQGNSIEDAKTKEILKDSQSRVYAMSAVHETLHGSENLSEINLKAYLTKVTTSTFQTYSAYQPKVKLNSNVGNSPISINQAYPLGLIINELISNSLKYAFPENREGEITMSMKKTDNQLELIVSDSGVGMPADFDWKYTDSLGLKLVRTLAEDQLDGSLDMKSEKGTKFIIKFNIET